MLLVLSVLLFVLGGGAYLMLERYGGPELRVSMPSEVSPEAGTQVPEGPLEDVADTPPVPTPQEEPKVTEAFSSLPPQPKHPVGSSAPQGVTEPSLQPRVSEAEGVPPATKLASSSVPEPEAPRCDTEEFLKEAWLAVERQELQEALRLYSLVLRRDPRNLEALINRGVVLKRLGRLQEAERDLRRALEISPAEGMALNALGVLEMERGRLAEAEELFRRAGDATAMVNLALLYWRKGEGDKVLELLDRATALDPEDPYPYYYRGLLLKGLGRKDEAEVLLQKAQALARQRADVELLRRLGALKGPG